MIRLADLPSDPGHELCNEQTYPEVLGLSFVEASAYEWLTWLPDVLSAGGCRVEVVEGWQKRGRPTSTGNHDPFGLLDHHTGNFASAGAPHPSLGVLVAGRSDLPGPLCHYSVGYDGVVRVVAAGRCNHAGKARAFGAMPAGDGNAMYIGDEIEYNGTQKMSTAQWNAVLLSNKAVLAKLGHGVDHLNRHQDTSLTGKWDNGGYTTSAMRAATAAIQPGDDVPLTPTDVQLILNTVIEPGCTVREALLDAHTLWQKKPWTAANPISTADALQKIFGDVEDLKDTVNQLQGGGTVSSPGGTFTGAWKSGA